MSAEVQVKKRRDNRKKRKDDAFIEDKENASYDQPLQVKATNGDLNIHIHKENTTGGGLCAKLVFLGLFTILVGLIALIINEHRENAELVTYTQAYSQFTRKPEESVPSIEESEENISEEEDDQETNAEAMGDDISSNEDGSVDNYNENEEEVDINELEESEADDENESSYEDAASDDEVYESAEAAKDKDQSVKLAHLDTDLQKPSSYPESSDVPNEDSAATKKAPVVTKDISLHAESLDDRENYHMVIKFGVGSALVIVAYVVLVKKWRTTNTGNITETLPSLKEDCDQYTPANLSRRNTIVIPPSLSDVQNDIENTEAEFRFGDNQHCSDDSSGSNTQPHRHYQDLQSSYSNLLTPDWEPITQRHALHSCDIDYKAEEGEEDLSENEDDFKQNAGVYDAEISDSEDEELLKRLEKKYGKLQLTEDDEIQSPSSDDKDDGDNDDGRDDDDDDDDNDDDDDDDVYEDEDCDAVDYDELQNWKCN